MLRSSRWISLLMLVVCGSSLVLGPAGCASGKPREKWWQFWRPKRVTTAMVGADGTLPPPGVLDSTLGPDGRPLRPDGTLPAPTVQGDLIEPETMRRPAQETGELMMVHFEFDSADLSREAEGILDQNLGWIKSHPNVQILIEGHCDERGTVEYNLNLGQRRAVAVKTYLAQRGIPDTALHTITYGEERPLDSAHSEAAYAKNRRAQFLVY